MLTLCRRPGRAHPATSPRPTFSLHAGAAPRVARLTVHRLQHVLAGARGAAALLPAGAAGGGGAGGDVQGRMAGAGGCGQCCHTSTARPGHALCIVARGSWVDTMSNVPLSSNQLIAGGTEPQATAQPGSHLIPGRNHSSQSWGARSRQAASGAQNSESVSKYTAMRRRVRAWEQRERRAGAVGWVGRRQAPPEVNVGVWSPAQAPLLNPGRTKWLLGTSHPAHLAQHLQRIVGDEGLPPELVHCVAA